MPLPTYWDYLLSLGSMGAIPTPMTPEQANAMNTARTRAVMGLPPLPVPVPQPPLQQGPQGMMTPEQLNTLRSRAALAGMLRQQRPLAPVAAAQPSALPTLTDEQRGQAMNEAKDEIEGDLENVPPPQPSPQRAQNAALAQQKTGLKDPATGLPVDLRTFRGDTATLQPLYQSPAQVRAADELAMQKALTAFSRQAQPQPNHLWSKSAPSDLLWSGGVLRSRTGAFDATPMSLQDVVDNNRRAINDPSVQPIAITRESVGENMPVVKSNDLSGERGRNAVDTAVKLGKSVDEQQGHPWAPEHVPVNPGQRRVPAPPAPGLGANGDVAVPVDAPVPMATRQSLVQQHALDRAAERQAIQAARRGNPTLLLGRRMNQMMDAFGGAAGPDEGANDMATFMKRSVLFGPAVAERLAGIDEQRRNRLANVGIENKKMEQAGKFHEDTVDISKRGVKVQEDQLARDAAKDKQTQENWAKEHAVAVDDKQRNFDLRMKEYNLALKQAEDNKADRKLARDADAKRLEYEKAAHDLAQAKFDQEKKMQEFAMSPDARINELAKTNPILAADEATRAVRSKYAKNPGIPMNPANASIALGQDAIAALAPIAKQEPSNQVRSIADLYSQGRLNEQDAPFLAVWLRSMLPPETIQAAERGETPEHGALKKVLSGKPIGKDEVEAISKFWEERAANPWGHEGAASALGTLPY